MPLAKYRLNRILEDVAALRAMTKHVELQSACIVVDEQIKEYWFSEISMDADDGDLFVKPDDVAVDDLGRWVLMASSGGEGGGSGPGTVLSSYQATEVAVDDDETREFELDPETGQTEVGAGVIMRLGLTTPGSSGSYLVELFRDAARTDFLTAFDIDTAIQPYTVLAIGYIADDLDDPKIYGRVSNYSGGTSDVTVDAEIAVIAAVDDITVNQVSPTLAANPGLELNAGALRVKAHTGLLRDANGLSIDPATGALLAGAQLFTGHKRFNSLGLVAQAGVGPPAAGTWAIGDLRMDASGHVWRCLEAGTPGKWALFVANDAADWWNSYGGSPDPNIAPETSYDGILDIVGRRVHLLNLQVLAFSNLAAEYNFGGRLELFSKETRRQEDMICPPFQLVFRKVEMSGANAAGQATVNVNSNGSIFAGDLVWLLDADEVDNEFGRISARPTGTSFTMMDDLANAYSDDAHVIYVNELGDVVAWNDSDTLIDQQKIFWRFHHDGKVADGDPEIERLYFKAKLLQLPGGMLG